MKFSVSVIIPVYNAEHFIEKAINSGLQQLNVLEVLVIDDGSIDKTLEIVKRLQFKDSRIQIYNHKNRENKGRSATRNVGIKKARANYVAFLDADDYYLEDRFLKDKQIFLKNENVDGVYNAIGAHFYRDILDTDQENLELYTVKEEMPSEMLFEALLSGKKGHFSIDGLTVKKSIFEKIGYFNEELEVMEDTELIWRMALKCQLITGVIDKPLAMRGVHHANVFNRNDLYQKNSIKFYESLIFWSSKNQISVNRIDALLNWIWLYKFKENQKLYRYMMYWGYLFFSNPRMLFSPLSIKYFPIVRLRKKLFSYLFNK